MAAGIKVPITYQYNEQSLDKLSDNFEQVVKSAQLGPAFDAEINNIRAKFKNIKEEIKRQFETGEIDVEKLNLTGLEKDIEKFAKGLAFVMNEALDDKEIENYTKQVTALADEIIGKQKEIRNLQKQRKDLGDERDAFKAKFGLAKMPATDPLEAERRLAAAEAELSASGGAGSDELKQRIEMFKQLIALMEKEQGARGSFYAAELEKAKKLSKESREETGFMITSGQATPGKNYAPVLFARQEKKDDFRQENLAFLEALAKGDESTVAAFYQKAQQEVAKLTELETQRAEKAALVAKLEEQKNKYFAEQEKLMNTVNIFEQKRIKMAKQYNAAEKKMTALRTKNESRAAAGISMQDHNFGGAFFRETGGLSKQELKVPISISDADKSIINIQAKIKEAMANGNKEQAKELKAHLKVVKEYKETYIEILKDLGNDTDKDYTKGMGIEASIGQTQRLASGLAIRRNQGQQKLDTFRKENDSGQDELFKNSVELDTLDNEIEILKERKELLENTRVIQKQMAEEQMAARKEFQAKFGLSAMPTGNADEAKQMLGAAEEEMKKGSAGDPELQNKVALHRELVVLLQKEKQTKEEINAKITDAQSVITERTNKKKEIEVKLDEKKKKLGDENNNVSRRALEIGAALNVLRDHGIKLTAKQQKEIEKLNKLVKQGNDDGDDEKKGLLARAGATFSYGLIIGQLRRVFQQTLQTVRELDKAMTEAAVVTSMNRKEAYELLGAYQQLARNTGLATSEVSGVVVEFLKQGRTMKDAMELAEVAAKSAKVAGISAQEAVKYLTSAVNGFGLAASQAEDIADKFAAVAASSATDFNELAIAMSKVSPVAKSAGVGVDFMMGVLAKGLETTREAPENIGTAFKTIFARMREVTDIGKATEDGMSLNRVEKALDSIGVRLRDSSGQFRNLETVLTDVGEKWTTLTSIEQAYIATSLAGTRQQPRLLAIFNDFARTKELINISTEATGELAFQHMEYMAGAEAALSQLRTAWEGFIMAFTETELVIGAINGITDIINFLSDTIKSLTGDNAFAGSIIAIGLVAIAYAGLTPKIAANMQQMVLESQVTKEVNRLKTENKALTAKQTLEVRKLTDEYKTATNVRRAEIRQTLESNYGIKLQSFSIKSVTKAIWLNVKAMAAQLAMQLLTAGIMMLVGAAIAFLVDLYKKATRNAADFAKEISENNKELKELSDKEKNVKKLIDRFDELSRKVTRTKEELNEMVSIAEELESIKIGDQEFNLSRTDVTGKIVIDKVAYENFVAAVERERQKLLAENLVSFNNAVKGTFTRIQDIFEDRPELSAMAKKIGFDFGSQFLTSMSEKGFSQENIEKAMAQLQSGMAGINPGLFSKATNLESIVSSMAPSIFDIQADPNKKYTDDQKRAAQDIVRMLAEMPLPKTSEELKENITKLIDSSTNSALKELTGVKKSNFIDRIANNFSNINFVFDEQKAKEFSQKAAGVLLNVAKQSEAVGLVVGENLTKEVKAQNLAKELDASLTAYRNAITAVKADTSLSDVEETVMLSFLTDSMQDEVILDTLTKGGITIETIVKVIERGTTLTGIADLIDSTRKKLESMTTTIPIDAGRDSEVVDLFTDTEIAEKMRQFNDVITAVFTETEDFSNFGQAYQKILDIFGNTPEAIEAINALSNSLSLLNATTAATKLSDQGKLVQDLLKLPEQIAKGDFSKYGELVTEFGFDTVNAVLQNGTAGLDAFFTKQKTDFTNSINEAIANIRATRTAIGEAGGEGNLSRSELEQIAQLELMLIYYEQIAGVEQLRAAVLKEVKDTVKETNDLYSLQDKLIKSGMAQDNPFIKMLDKAILASENSSLTALQDQVEKDVLALGQLGSFVDGVFVKLADSSQIAVDSGLENMLESATQLLEMQTAAYEREKKVIEERYKEEIDAIKSSNDEKWKAIEYSDRLIDMEEQVAKSRRMLLGLSLSGASSGTLQEAQKELQKIQKERQKIIEQQMVEEAQKQLEKERDDRIQQLGAAQITAMSGLTRAIEYLTQTIQQRTNTAGEPNDPALFGLQ
jgi:TP901 family phage tail tape measure protein